MIVQVKLQGIAQFQKIMANIPTKVERKAQQALNRTLTRSRTQMTNSIGEKLNLKKKTIRELIFLKNANKNTGLIGSLIVKPRLVSLIEYNAKQNRKGVSFKIFKNRPRQTINQAFIFPDSRGRLTVFKRETKARLKIKPLYGTRAVDAAKDSLTKVKVFAEQFFQAEIKRMVNLKI
ncbi:MAG TPA: hypothetical protein VFP93_00010 [Gammaproteobacteria bacterium]|nr:hypothetical protein [Gammaproteobacteria bacterium]